ncbi:MAG: hypothetical protein KKE61_06640 [Proteobacteria bacterium]|nr:hypothetical protein [Pseudomonadota bacterium]
MPNYFKTLNIDLILIAGLLLFLLSGNAYSDMSKSDIPQMIKAGLDAYKTGGPEAAIADWIKDSPYEGSKDAMSQANIFKQIESFYGSYIDYNPIAIIYLTPSTRLVYLSMDFDNGPVFAEFMIYKKNKGWILSGKFNFHTEPRKILPESLLDIRKD